MVHPAFKPFNFIVNNSTQFAVISGDKSFIDFSGSAMTTGYNFIKPEWLSPTVSKLIYANNYTTELSDLLLKGSNFDNVAFTTSGTEACDATLSRSGNPFLALEGAYHGLTYITKIVSNGTGIDWDNNVIHLKHPGLATDLETVLDYNKKLIKNFYEKKHQQGGSVIIELVQSDGGINVLSVEFVKSIEELARKLNLNFIVDEVYTGYGRSGEMLLYKKYRISPDMVCLGKGMAAGMPMGAVLYKGEWDLPYNQVISMQSGNMFLSRIAIEVLRSLDNTRLEFVRRNGQSIVSRLSKIKNPMISEVRGIGFMIGIEFKGENGKNATDYAYKVRNNLEKKGVICSLTGEDNNVLKITPPVLIDSETLETGISIIEDTLENWNE